MLRAVQSGILIVTMTLVAQAQSYTWRNVQIYGGGFVDGIVFNQSEPNLVYTRTDIGGAYRLDNTTGRWVTQTIGPLKTVRSGRRRGVGQHIRTLALDRLGHKLHKARERGGSRQHRFRQSCDRADVPGALRRGASCRSNGRGIFYGDGQ